MADSPPPPPLPPRQRDGGDKPAGWPVPPAPDGRGAPPPEKPRGGVNFGRRFLLVVLVLFGINFWITTLIPSGHERIRVPYFPTFLNQVTAKNVASISSTGSTIQGEFRTKITYPKGTKDPKTSKFFDTEVPTFANSDQL